MVLPPFDRPRRLLVAGRGHADKHRVGEDQGHAEAGGEPGGENPIAKPTM